MHIPPPAIRQCHLRELLPEARFPQGADICIQRVATDSRCCQAGDVFFALRGCQHDGHDFAAAAVAQGAAAVVAERVPPGLPHHVPVCLVPDAGEALGRICQHLAGNPSRSLRVVGITGTNGKTTTSYLIASVLGVGGFPTGILGTLAYCDGTEIEPADLTTPSAPVLADWLSRMVTNHCTHAVMEVSSHALAQRRVAGIMFDTACATNIRHDHLDLHGTYERYWEAKARLFSQLAPEGVAVVNADDRGSAELLELIDTPALSVGIDSAAEITATIIEQTISDQTFLLNAGSQTVPVRTTLIGTHNVYNCLIAAAVGLGYGLDVVTIARGLEAVEAIPGRLERIECGQPFGVFVDYAHTPDALHDVLRTLRDVTRGRLICVFGAGGNRDRFKRPRMARAVEKVADLAIVTTDNPRHEDPQEIIDQIVVGFRNPHRVRTVLDRGAAIELALSCARQGDCVLIAGKGHEDYQIVGDERRYFDDRQFARHCLYAAPPLLAFRAAA
jgi:UDP-N-acetylmuramoyl-L-alanyl-D-glutamate--2,6-diaminopimelate ligase